MKQELIGRSCSLKHQYVPDDAARAVGLEGNEKGRFTSLLAGNGASQMLPQMDIVKVACQNPNDLTTSRVLDGYMKDGGPCPASAGWVKRIWEGDIYNSKKKKKEHHKRLYLWHPETLHVITVQLKACCDTPACVMYVELLLTPYKARHFPNALMLMVLDNCGPHKTPDIETAFKKAGWLMEFLPPNMTD